jgi:molecular chaperone GrpE
MSKQDKSPRFRGAADESDEVEILEVVGFDEEDSAAATAEALAEPGGPFDPDAGEFVLSLDDDVETGRELAESGLTDRQKLLRLRADYDNLQKRIDREKEEFELHANSNLVSQILPVLDNFERALLQAGGGVSDRAFRDGVALIYKQLTDELRREGLRAIEAVGRRFDPHLHDAVETDPDSPEPANTVVEELQRGYVFQNRLLRPALVRVSTGGARDGRGEGA